MRPLKSSERRLAMMFAGSAFLVANFVGFGFLQEKRRSLENDIHNLHLEEAQANFWTGQSAFLSKRKTWLENKQPRFSGAGQESGNLQQSLQQSARQEKITIQKQSFPETSKNPNYQEVAVQLEIKGSLESVTRWIASLQKPESFQAITRFNLRSDTEAPNVLATLTVSRWYASP